MAINDPNELERVDREIRRNELREKAAEVNISEECPSDLEAEFIDGMREYEEAPLASCLDRLARRRGYEPPDPETLAGEALAVEISRLASELAALHIFLTSTDHLSDRELYSHLVEDTLLELEPDVGVQSGWFCHIDILGGCSEEDIDLWLKHYATEDDRQRWAADFPDSTIPAHQPLPFDRDKHLPQPSI